MPLVPLSKECSMSIKAYKYRIYANKQTTERLAWVLERCRELYNAGATSTYLLTLSEATNKEVCW